MTKLIQRMREELVRCNYAETTIRSYLQAMEDFRRFVEKRLDQVSSRRFASTKVISSNKGSWNLALWPIV